LLHVLGLSFFHYQLTRCAINIRNHCFGSQPQFKCHDFICCAVSCRVVSCRALLYVAAVLTQAASFRLSHEKVFTPLVTLAILIQQNPQLAALRKSFPKVAQQLLESVGSSCAP
jgi:hypothetical protein